jgi:hypothetical protein
MILKPTNAQHAVYLVHVSATHVAIFREVHYKEYIYRKRVYPREGLTARSHPQNLKSRNLKKHILGRYYDIKSFTSFPFQPKTASEID